MEPLSSQLQELNVIDLKTLIIKSPISEYTPNDQSGIECISIDENYTRIDFIYISPKKYPNGGWVKMDRNAYIQICGSNKKYHLLKAINIPLDPDKYYFKKTGQVLQFTLLFPAIPKTTTSIDIIERLEPGNYFNFFRVSLVSGQAVLININNNLN